jgi:hypothetical protein
MGGTLPPDNASGRRLIAAIEIACAAGGDTGRDGRPVRTWAHALLGRWQLTTRWRRGRCRAQVSQHLRVVDVVGLIGRKVTRGAAGLPGVWQARATGLTDGNGALAGHGYPARHPHPDQGPRPRPGPRPAGTLAATRPGPTSRLTVWPTTLARHHQCLIMLIISAARPV